MSAQDITLPVPQKTGGKPLYDAVAARQSTREFTTQDISLQDMSDLLWVAFGFNRTDKRVIPTPKDTQNMTVYVFTKDKVYEYDAKTNTLIWKADGDHRKKVGMQDYVYDAPLNFVYFIDSTSPFAAVDPIPVGAAAQNVYLAAADKGLGVVVRTGGLKENTEALQKLLKLTKQNVPVAAQTIGHKK